MLSEVNRGVLPVVEEPFQSAHITHGGLGHNDAFEPGRHVTTRLCGRANTGHAHQVARRDHTEQSPVLDHRQVPVVV